MNGPPPRLRGLFLALALVALAAIGFAAVRQFGAHSGAAIGGPFTLAASDGRQVTDRSFHGKWLLLFFGYTHCPDVCPTALANIAVALEKLGPEAERLQPLFITIDPARDNTARLARWLQPFDPRILGLTGSDADIAAVAREYGVYFSAHESAAQRDYALDHSALIYVMNPEGKFVTGLDPALSGAQIAEKLQAVFKKGA